MNKVFEKVYTSHLDTTNSVAQTVGPIQGYSINSCTIPSYMISTLLKEDNTRDPV